MRRFKHDNIRFPPSFLHVLLVPRKFTLSLGFSGKFHLNMMLFLPEQNDSIKILFYKVFINSGSEKRQHEFESAIFIRFAMLTVLIC